MAVIDTADVARLKGPLPEKLMKLKRAKVVDGLSRLTETTIDFVSPDPNLDLGKIVGQPMGVLITQSDVSERAVHGVCVGARFIGVHRGTAHYTAELRPWLWFLTRSKDSRIFQDKTVLDIIDAVLEPYGFASKISKKTSESYKPRGYCVQYRETDFDFLCRLMEEEGLYFFFDQSGSAEVMVITDGASGHSALAGHGTVPFEERDEDIDWKPDHLFEWQGKEAVTSGKVTLKGFDFEKPKADLTTVKAIPKGKHAYKDIEVYDYTDHHLETSLGDQFAKVKMEALAAENQRWRALGNVRGMAVGGTFALADHPRKAENAEYLVVACTHYYQDEKAYDGDGIYPPGLDTLVFHPDNLEAYQCEVEVQRADVPYRAPQITPWPEIAGVHTAIVVGKKGEEIWTDKYGRIKVQFHWDRQGKKDENASCWVRVASPWSGKNWGAIYVPRMGQEVVIQFEEGDPSRPICVGTLYNADTMPPYGLPANATMQGIKTNKSKGGGGFNELVMEDKAGAEYVRFQSERDYKQIIKNNAEITIGLEHSDKGDMTETIHRHKTQTLKTGDHTYKIAQGSQKIDIAKDQTETIKGKSTRTVTQDVKETYKAKLTQTVTGNVTQTVKQGNYKQEIKMGNVSHKVGMGSVKQEVKMGSVSRKVSMGSIKDTISLGNFKMKASLGKITMQAMQAIELKVGANKLKIDMSGITLDATMIKIKGKGMAQMEAPMVTVKGSGMTKVEAPMTMIEGKAMTQIKAPMTMADASALLMLKGTITMVN